MEYKLFEIAEMWWTELGKLVPEKSTKEYQEMYESWWEYAFSDLK